MVKLAREFRLNSVSLRSIPQSFKKLESWLERLNTPLLQVGYPIIKASQKYFDV